MQSASQKIKINAAPVAGQVFQTELPELAMMSRDQLKVLVNRAVTWPKGANAMADAVLDEWNGRVGYQQMARAKAEYAEEQADVSFRMEVIEELVATGIARHVAANLTNTEAKLMAKAREIGYI